jgi:uncharacterized protein (UPF0147 family)
MKWFSSSMGPTWPAMMSMSQRSLESVSRNLNDDIVLCANVLSMLSDFDSACNAPCNLRCVLTVAVGWVGQG